MMFIEILPWCCDRNFKSRYAVLINDNWECLYFWEVVELMS